eukprot:TRINITY_DN1896_c0_g1_i4.p1 TRINITY_DN1896_c0_g1~~TRINITY_DN1896_c0_g1_i4.p1  ORF type:complete len:173 (+),score=20.25 TRINITY_DN1896_c0_g1_i4:98-616(+)
MSTSSCNKPAKMDVTRFVCSKRRPVSEYELCTAFGEAAAAQAREATAKGELECFEDENERIYFPPAKCDAASLEATISAIDAEIAKLSSMSARYLTLSSHIHFCLSELTLVFLVWHLRQRNDSVLMICTSTMTLRTPVSRSWVNLHRCKACPPRNCIHASDWILKTEDDISL